jgi:ABC-type uncharacterized transport system substrate-binding protein
MVDVKMIPGLAQAFATSYRRWRRGIANMTIGAAALAAGLFAMANPATAHPHVWISVVAELLYGADGSITGVRQQWTFDEMFSSFAIRGVEQKTPGVFSHEALATLAKTYVDGLKDFNYFTFAKLDGQRQENVFTDPVDYSADYDPAPAAMTLSFTLPLKSAVPAKSLEIQIYDPQIYFYLSFARFDPVHLIGAPPQCRPLVKTSADEAAAISDSTAGMVTTSTSTIWVKCS